MINYLHEKHIVHKDIRLETLFVITNKAGEIYLELMSFDNAQFIPHKEYTMTKGLSGTEFSAPEIF